MLFFKSIMQLRKSSVRSAETDPRIPLGYSRRSMAAWQNYSEVMHAAVKESRRQGDFTAKGELGVNEAVLYVTRRCERTR